jgi:hypothetical protein
VIGCFPSNYCEVNSTALGHASQTAEIRKEEVAVNVLEASENVHSDMNESHLDEKEAEGSRESPLSSFFLKGMRAKNDEVESIAP